jgi:hypothetical protein
MSGALVRHWCERCQAYRDGAGIRQLTAGAGSISSCATCGGALRSEIQRVKPPLFGALLGSFVFPVGSIPVIATWVGVSVASVFVSFVPLIGGFLSVTLVLWYLFAIVRVTSLGHDDFGDVGYDALHPSEWFHPLIRYVLTLAVAFSPALVTFALLGPSGAILAWLVGFLGLLYLPAGMVVAAHAEGCLSPLNPTVAIRLMARIPGAYALTLVALALALGAGVAVAWLVGTFLSGSIAFALVGRIAGLYAPSVMARMLGVMVREESEEL